MNTYTYTPKYVCSREIRFGLEDGKIHDLSFVGGCDGNLRAIGKLLEGKEAEEAIRSAYVNGGFYNAVTVRVVCPDMLLEQLYFVDGETHKTGSFSFRDNITLQQAIITAGGLTQFADGTIQLRRGGVITTYDLNRISQGKAEDPRLLPGDILSAQKRWF